MVQNNMILRAENLVKKYKQRSVVNDVTFNVAQGEIVGLLGPNGAGKTTSFYMIVGLIKPNEGKIFLDDEEITGEPMYRRAQKGIGYLAQEASVFRKLSVEDNIKAVLEMGKMPKDQQRDKLEELIDEFSLHKVRRNRGDLLSGGERRRTEIARALVAKLRHRNIGILITDHNVQETLSITDRAYLLFEGKLLESGVPEVLAANEMVRKVYLGANFVLKRKTFAQ